MKLDVKNVKKMFDIKNVTYYILDSKKKDIKMLDIKKNV